jgi:hypothetical protein
VQTEYFRYLTLQDAVQFAVDTENQRRCIQWALAQALLAAWLLANAMMYSVP